MNKSAEIRGRPAAAPAWRGAVLHPVTVAALTLGAGLHQAAAQGAPPAKSEPPPTQLERVVVTADPLGRGELDSARPVNLVRGDELRAKEGTSLGETLSRELGVQSSQYGPGAGRPVVRGMDSARVRITESGLGVADVSGASPDHRVAADTLASPQVEVLRGPATLLYGSGAIGGLVNVVSERIPQQWQADARAGVHVRATTAEHERAAAFDADGPAGAAASWRIEGYRQKTEDYALARPLRDGAGAVIAPDRLPNSAADTRSTAIGAAWFPSGGDRSDRSDRLGAAIQRYESDYGIPNPADPVTIRLRRSRVEINGDWGPRDSDGGSGLGHGDEGRGGAAPILRAKLAYTDYRHTEFDAGGTAAASFTNRGTELRIEHPYRRGRNRGVIGTQLQQFETRGAGEGELPATEQNAIAGFAVNERQFGALRWELGGRLEAERYRVSADYAATGGRAPSRRFTPFTASTGVTWSFEPGWETGLTWTEAQRAPAVEELYFVGAHPATFAFEIGNSELRKERSRNLDASLRYGSERLRARAGVFVNRVRDYIYGFFDGATTDVLDENGNVEQRLSNLVFTQADARFHGAEAQLELGARTGWNGRLWGDTVRAKLASGPNRGDNLPRLSPARAGADVGWRAAQWSLSAQITRVQRQSRTASFDRRNGDAEQATPGYTRVDAIAQWRTAYNEIPLTFLLQARNLTNQDMRIHTSFLKDVAPPPGRSLWLGARAAF